MTKIIPTQAIVKQAQSIFTATEKDIWKTFEDIRDAKYTGKGSREVKRLAVNEAREILQIARQDADDTYAKAVGAL